MSRLLDVAVEHFGRFGIDGASTRKIAEGAKTPMSSITYHFGGKEGLYRAAASHIADSLSELIAPAIEEAMRDCEIGCSRERAREALHSIFAHAAGVLNGPNTASLARFIIREQADPTPAFTRIYENMMEPMLGRIALLLDVVAGGKLTDCEARVRAIALFGQVLVFRVARETALRGAYWKTIGATEIGVIQHIVGDHLEAVLERLSRRAGSQ